MFLNQGGLCSPRLFEFCLQAAATPLSDSPPPHTHTMSPRAQRWKINSANKGSREEEEKRKTDSFLLLLFFFRSPTPPTPRPPREKNGFQTSKSWPAQGFGFVLLGREKKVARRPGRPGDCIINLQSCAITVDIKLTCRYTTLIF